MTNQTTIPISNHLGRILDVARQCDLPVLLNGQHGIGKSEFLVEYARKRGIKAMVLDLSLLDATDLTGIPYIKDEKTHFAPPHLLPDSNTTDEVILILEELNRCDRSVRQPCLQLLTSRKLNTYVLPPKCFLVACVNPYGEDYEVDEFDPALLSRFLQVSVYADVSAWLKWAKANDILPSMIDFIDTFPQAFDRLPPRTWTYASHLLSKALEQHWTMDELPDLLNPLLGDLASKSLLRHLSKIEDLEKSLEIKDLILNPDQYTDLIQDLVDRHRIDRLSSLAQSILSLLATVRPPYPTKLEKLLLLIPKDLAVPVLKKIQSL